MYPNCSLYGMQAFQNLDPLTAMMRTADRLHRCGHDLQWYEPILVGGIVRPYDPHPELAAASAGAQNAQWDAGVSSTGLSLEPPSWTAIDALRFGRTLLVKGEYDLAILEFRRLLFLFPDSECLSDVYDALFRAHMQREEYDEALSVTSEAESLASESGRQSLWHYNRGVVYYQMEDFRRALGELRFALTNADETIGQRAPMLIGLISARRFDWDDASEVFRGIPRDNIYYQHALRCAELAAQGNRLPRKSPTLAGILSIVPGGGYLYDGHNRTALSAFLVNGLFLWGTVSAFKSDNAALGIIMGTFTLSWYSGSIHGGVSSARRYNHITRQNHSLRFAIGFSPW